MWYAVMRYVTSYMHVNITKFTGDNSNKQYLAQAELKKKT